MVEHARTQGLRENNRERERERERETEREREGGAEQVINKTHGAAQ